jgi:hypothetical protein
MEMVLDHQKCFAMDALEDSYMRNVHNSPDYKKTIRLQDRSIDFSAGIGRKNFQVWKDERERS